ncbi:pentatricopeptide repeat-containing family protein [Tripterygium wilfordii]|uniref:Pentatricopeptide repeat-containing family protein n=1 Tax=Tripterygium wilfordii TaxID=458696 RepID=A0A7J7DIX9_TRIWF|nr:pentatricopeptide repeat-containing family protein [Tripterygium wilfordii]
MNKAQFIFLLRNCKQVNQIPPIHAKIIRSGHEQDPFIVFELLRLCSTFKDIDYASTIFNFSQNPNVYLYTALIDGFVLSGSHTDGISLYCKMVEESIIPDSYAVTSALKACGSQLALREGKQIHCQVSKLGLTSSRSVRMKLIELYGKCGALDDARQVSDEITKDTVCWTAMIDGLVRNGDMNRALQVFRDMQRENVMPNEVTIVCVLSACAQLGALELGRWVHSYMRKFQIERNHFVCGALINMYARCGDIDEARRVFEEMKERNVITYNSMISGFALHGKSVEAIKMFRGMIKQGIRPTSVTFVGVLNACSHGGLVDSGFEIFHSMTRDYGIEPQIEHYGCMVDLLGRVGRLEEAYNFIRGMKIPPDHIMLGALLSACKIHGNIELGEQIAKLLMDCGEADSGTYVLLSNVYASSGKWRESAQVRAKMKEGGIRKEPGCSAIEVNNEIHEFILGDLRHPQKEQIYAKLEEVNHTLRSKGYTPATEVVLQDIEDQEKEMALAIHSERLAICYGLISTKPHTTIRVAKNLRVCSDCHSTIKLISRITSRRIVVRDRNRFHHFENGDCSCGDYW